MRPSINPQSAKLNNLNNVHPLEVLSRYRDPQVKGDENKWSDDSWKAGDVVYPS